MGKKVRVFLGENDLSKFDQRKDCKRADQNCYLCDLLNCQYVNKNGEKIRVGLVRLFGKEVPIYFSQQEMCWLPYSG